MLSIAQLFKDTFSDVYPAESAPVDSTEDGPVEGGEGVLAPPAEGSPAEDSDSKDVQDVSAGEHIDPFGYKARLQRIEEEVSLKTCSSISPLFSLFPPRSSHFDMSWHVIIAKLANPIRPRVLTSTHPTLHPPSAVHPSHRLGQRCGQVYHRTGPVGP